MAENMASPVEMSGVLMMKTVCVGTRLSDIGMMVKVVVAVFTVQ